MVYAVSLSALKGCDPANPPAYARTFRVLTQVFYGPLRQVHADLQNRLTELLGVGSPAYMESLQVHLPVAVAATPP